MPSPEDLPARVGAGSTSRAEPASRWPASYTLEWRVPSACPDEEALRELISGSVERREDGTGTLEVRGTIEEGDGGFTLHLDTRYFERVDTRHAQSARCEDLAESVALVVAVALDPSLRPEEPAGLRDVVPESSVPPTAPEARSEVPAPQTAPPAPSPSAPRARARPQERPAVRRTLQAPGRFLVRLEGQFDYGRVPPPGGGVALTLGVTWRPARLELYGSYLGPRRGAGPGGTGGLYQWGGAGLRGCGLPHAGPVVFPLCLGLEAGALRVDSRGLSPSRRVHGRWLAPTAAAGLLVGQGSVAFWSLAEAAVVALGSRIRVGERVVFRPPPVAARLLVGLELRFAIE